MLDFDYKKSVDSKDILGANGVWRTKFAPSDKIGNCTRLYRKLKPESEEDFYRKYLENGKNNSNQRISYRGLSYDELVNSAECYRKEYNEKYNTNYDTEVFFHNMVLHIIIETFAGQKREKNFSKFLGSLGYSCDYFEPSVDAKYGLDIKVTRADGRVSAIQIKPESFFKSNRHNVQLDRLSLCRKYEAAVRDLGVKTYYAIYKSGDSEEWIKNGDGYRFKINELFDYDPEDIEGTFSRLSLPKTAEKLPTT